MSVIFFIQDKTFVMYIKMNVTTDYTTWKQLAKVRIISVQSNLYKCYNRLHNMETVSKGKNYQQKCTV